ADPALAYVDPRDGTLPAWLWLTLCTLILACLLFISFRRLQALELYERGKAHLLSKLPSFSLTRGIRLSDGDLETDPFSSLPSHRSSRRSRRNSGGEANIDDEDDASETSSLHSDADELPASSPSLTQHPPQSRRSYSFLPPTSSSSSSSSSSAQLASSAVAQVQRSVGSVLDTLGWGAGGRGGAFRGEGDKSAGIASAFWGLRKDERTGGIRLAGGNGMRRDQESELGGGGVRGGGRAGRGHARSQSAASDSSGTALFDLGDDADEPAELPTDFSLPPSSGNTSRS
ncbi:hypothetical protein JCM8547_003757, partial [Rhodosporidiobolus lusitaniae]